MSLALRFLLCFTFLNALVFSTSAKPMVADDIGIAEILRPAPSECGNNVLVEVRVQNYGDNSVTSFFISYTVDGTLVANYLSVDSLGPGQSIEVAFPALTLADGNHSLEVETSLPNGNNDGDTGNDKKVKSFSILISQGLTAPYFESFESGTWPPTDWILQNPDNSVGWQETSLASVTGNTSIYMDNFNYNAIGQVDEFQTAGFDLTGETKIALSFYLAYAPFGDNTGFADTLEIWVSGNCGLNYDRVYKAWGQDLATAPATTSMFVPASWMWKKVWVDISDYAGSTYFVANFRHTTNYENNLYIDVVSIEEFTALDIDDPSELGAMELFPNPASDQVAVKFEAKASGPLDISITNLQGAAVWQKTMPHAPGLMEISLPVGELAAGFYMVTLKEEGRTLTKKLTIE